MTPASVPGYNCADTGLGHSRGGQRSPANEYVQLFEEPPPVHRRIFFPPNTVERWPLHYTAWQIGRSRHPHRRAADNDQVTNEYWRWLLLRCNQDKKSHESGSDVEQFPSRSLDDGKEQAATVSAARPRLPLGVHAPPGFASGEDRVPRKVLQRAFPVLSEGNFRFCLPSRQARGFHF